MRPGNAHFGKSRSSSPQEFGGTPDHPYLRASVHERRPQLGRPERRLRARPSSGLNGASWLVSLISKVPIGRLSVHNHPEQPIAGNVLICRYRYVAAYEPAFGQRGSRKAVAGQHAGNPTADLLGDQRAESPRHGIRAL
jgi:hypothetical protein